MVISSDVILTAFETSLKIKKFCFFFFRRQPLIYRFSNNLSIVHASDEVIEVPRLGLNVLPGVTQPKSNWNSSAFPEVFLSFWGNHSQLRLPLPPALAVTFLCSHPDPPGGPWPSGCPYSHFHPAGSLHSPDQEHAEASHTAVRKAEPAQLESRVKMIGTPGPWKGTNTWERESMSCNLPGTLGERGRRLQVEKQTVWSSGVVESAKVTWLSTLHTSVQNRLLQYQFPDWFMWPISLAYTFSYPFLLIGCYYGFLIGHYPFLLISSQSVPPLNWGNLYFLFRKGQSEKATVVKELLWQLLPWSPPPDCWDRFPALGKSHVLTLRQEQR